MTEWIASAAAKRILFPSIGSDTFDATVVRREFLLSKMKPF
jgi:hypothetical protein